MHKLFYCLLIIGKCFFAMEGACLDILSPEIIDTIFEYVATGETAHEICKNIYSYGRLKKYCVKYLRDVAISEKIILKLSQNHKTELFKILPGEKLCFHDEYFYAAYFLNTSGAREWMKSKYLTQQSNFLLVNSFLVEFLYKKQKEKTKIIAFIKNIMPEKIPKRTQTAIDCIALNFYNEQKAKFTWGLLNPHLLKK